MRVLIVGAGAVGQVFGRHLALGGADVTFYVKDKYAAEARAGFPMYPLNVKRHPREQFDGFGVMTTPAEVAAATWDQVFLTVSSTALRAGTWLGELAAATKQATVVCLAPNLGDRAFVLDHVAADRIVDGTIGFVSYHAPMPGETRFTEPGMAYWFPPMSPSPFCGSDARVGAVVDALRRGKLPAKRVRDLTSTAPFPSAMLYAYISALEGAGWSFATLRQGDRLATATRGARQMFAIVGRQLERKPPLGIRLAARPTVIRLVLIAQRRVVPLDLEMFFRVHFTKVGDQTRHGIAQYVALGQAAGLPTDAIETLLAYVAA